MALKKSSRVLIADDSEPCLRICAISLKQAGFAVTVVRCVAEALEALEKEGPRR
ncbi:MAG TPA: response regulator [Candidatus Methylacidiphilales bacterium]